MTEESDWSFAKSALRIGIDVFAVARSFATHTEITAIRIRFEMDFALKNVSQNHIHAWNPPYKKKTYMNNESTLKCAWFPDKNEII